MSADDPLITEDPLRDCRLAPTDSEAPHALADATGLTLIRLCHPNGGGRPDVLVPLCGPVTQRDVSQLSHSLLGGLFHLVPVEQPPETRSRSCNYDKCQFLLLPNACSDGDSTGDAKVADELTEAVHRLPAVATSAERARRAGAAASIGELTAFAHRFRSRREELRYAQADACLALRRLYGCRISQAMLSRFELADLTLDNMIAMWPLLRRWLADLEAREVGGPSSADAIVAAAATAAASIGGNVASFASDSRQRRPRSRHTGTQVAQMERHFLHTPKPSKADYIALSARLGLPVRVVRCWFGNRRQRERRADPDNPMADAFHSQLSFAMVAKSHT